MDKQLFSQAVSWPSIVSYQNDDELIYIESEDQWLAELAAGQLEAGDRLIDSAGVVFAPDKEDTSCLFASSDPMTLDGILQLVRKHASVCGHCCVSKMGAPSRVDAIQLVKEIE